MSNTPIANTAQRNFFTQRRKGRKETLKTLLKLQHHYRLRRNTQAQL